MAALFAAFLMQDHSKCLFHGKSCQKGNSKEKIPLPKCIHKIMNKQDIGNQDILVIGDVHGCLDELQLLIIKANELTANNCVFIFCGDLINKGPSSKETLDFVRNLGSKAFVIRGNNEDRVLKHCLASKNNPNYISSLKSRYHWLPELTDDDIEYLIDLPYTISIPDLNTVIVHAGLNPWIPLCLQSLDDMVHMRNITGIDNACRVQPQSDIHQGFPWALFWLGEQHVYFGHDARRGLQTYPHATGLDTGCVYGRKLTAKFITGNKQYLSVDAKMKYA